MGLIDIDCFFFPSKEIVYTTEKTLKACEAAIRFFPYHFETIWEQAKKISPEIEE